MALCKKCGEREQHTFPNGRIVSLCAVCGWNALVEFLESPDIGGLTQRAADVWDVCHECGATETIDPNNDGVPICVECGTRR